MHVITKAAAAAAVGTGAVLLGAAAAQASPGQAPTSSEAMVDCGAAGSGTVVVNSGNSQALTWNPFFLTDSSGRTVTIVPTALHLTVTNNGDVFSIDATKGSAPGSVTCTVSGGGDGLVVSGTLTGNLNG